MVCQEYVELRRESESSYRVIKAGVLHKDDMKCFTKSPGNGETPQSPARGWVPHGQGKSRTETEAASIKDRVSGVQRTESDTRSEQKGQKRSSTSLHTLNQRDGACNLGWEQLTALRKSELSSGTSSKKNKNQSDTLNVSLP